MKYFRLRDDVTIQGRWHLSDVVLATGVEPLLDAGKVVPPPCFDPPILWLPQAADNSSGGQVWLDDRRFGPLAGVIRTNERYGVVLAEGSALTPSVNRALVAMAADGTIDRLSRTWLAVDLAGLRVLR